MLLDGVPLREWRLDALRRQFALVSQDVVLFNDTVAANVALGDAVDVERVRSALASAHLLEFALGLPQGIDTLIGHNGNQLSGGQRQRLAIARAIYKDAPVLILDEATSALDSESERAVQDALERADAGPHDTGHRAPPVDHRARRPRGGDGPGPHRRERQPCRADRPRRALRAPARHAIQELMWPTPEAASPLPLKGAPLAAWQSQIRGGRSGRLSLWRSAVNNPISRWPVPELKDLPDDLRARILDVQAKAGFVPNVFLGFAHRPDEARAFFAWHDALLLKEDSGLTKAEREMIIVATSGANGCLYCVVAHGAILRVYAKQPQIADQVATNYLKADISERQRAMLAFALKVSQDSANLVEADFAALRVHGFSDEDIWDIGAITALFGLSNRMANLISLRPNDEFYLLGRLPREKK